MSETREEEDLDIPGDLGFRRIAVRFETRFINLPALDDFDLSSALRDELSLWDIGKCLRLLPPIESLLV